ncbi:hypothetical protein SKB45_001379 [Salmonella enterica]|uniref:Uncharacterized protein n=1 Tax=Salmonella enterica TaxID=28901 RepID=A0A763CGB5_SALER|nr:hypothetical protein [Salmonella enterica]EDQ0146595.1 hypothetical protein [Salmonella enterica subsp. enterica serovar Sandiego]EDV7107436.1 hypothetical protein [Salmonella enterica subsp. enterica]EIB5178796.1 hypothetical protein [Salmonella enterica subsp. enterica serovar Maracaibo]EDN6225626.1 hypothetical protein [Salmonella enterica]EDN6265192.1 hypothetical protein [Salmonella enterica]
MNTIHALLQMKKNRILSRLRAVQVTTEVQFLLAMGLIVSGMTGFILLLACL